MYNLAHTDTNTYKSKLKIKKTNEKKTQYNNNSKHFSSVQFSSA